jgi:hypothetical protein
MEKAVAVRAAARVRYVFAMRAPAASETSAMSRRAATGAAVASPAATMTA